MNYYKFCRKNLKEEEFTELVTKLVKKITIKFSDEISLEELVKILEINMSTILILTISKIIRLEPAKINEKLILKESGGFLVEENLQEFTENYKKYINLLEKSILNNMK